MTAVPGPSAEGARGLLGRGLELTRLLELLETDTPTLVVGEAGVGKTTLVRAAVQATGRRFFEGGGFASLAWAPLLAIERALGSNLIGVDAAFAARELARAVGDGVLFIDDLHWVDPTSREALAELVGRLGLVVGARLGDPATDAVIAGLPGGCARIDLEPLGEADAAELATRVRPDLRPGIARQVARRAGGNPLLVTELAGGGAEGATLAAVIRQRLATLDRQAREAMTLLALAGRPMPAQDLGPGAGRLASAGLAIVDGDGRLRVRHELIADAAAEGLGEDERRTVHEQLARLITDPGEAARHHLAADEHALARDRALEAATAATTPGERAAHLEIAALSTSGPGATRLVVQAAEALIDALEPARARALLDGLPESDDPEVALIEARAYRAEYELGRARVALTRAVATVAPDDHALMVAIALERARLAAREMGTAEDILAAAHNAVAVARRHGLATAEAREILGEARLLAGDLGGLDDLGAAMADAMAAGEPMAALRTGNRLVFGYLKAGRAADGRALVRELASLATGLRLASWEDQMKFWASGFAWHGGDPRGAWELSAPVDEGPASSDGGWYGIQALADLGRFDEARVRAARAVEESRRGEYDLGEALWVSADVAFMSGRFADAIAFAERHAVEVPGAHHRMFVELPAAWATVELGRPPTWPARISAMPIDAGGTDELIALRSLAAGDVVDAAARFDAATEAWTGRHARGEWRTRWATGECLRRSGQTDEALRRLLVLEEQLVAASEVPMLARTHRSLRRLGIRRAAPQQPSPGSPLTVRERQILDLSGRGLRDGEIASRLGVSRWAVVRSAESAAAKLGTQSRAEAVVVAMRG